MIIRPKHQVKGELMDNTGDLKKQNNMLHAYSTSRDDSSPINFNMTNNHYHDCYEMYFYLGNEMTYFIENESLILYKYDLILIDKSIYHRTFYNNSDNSQRINVSFSQTDISPIGNEKIINKLLQLFKIKKIRFINIKHQHLIGEMLKRLCEICMRSVEYEYLIRARIVLCDIFLTIADITANDGIEKTISQNLNPPQKRISEIVKYINNNYASPITLEILAKKFFINKFYLSHVFKDITGLGITEFVNRKRLSEAEILLKYSSNSITEICTKTGFNNMSHFINLFKRTFNCTPKEMKKG